MKRKLNDEFETLVVITTNGTAEYVEYDTLQNTREEMIEMLKESDEIQSIWESISNIGPIGLIWKRDEQIEDEQVEENKLSDEDYESLVRSSSHPEVLDFYDLSAETGELFEKIYTKLGFPKHDEWVVHPDVLNDDDKMNKLYDEIRKELVKLANNQELDNAFDSARDKHYGEHETVKQIMKMFNLRAKFDSKPKHFKDRIMENGGWKLDSENAWRAWEEWIEEVGVEKAADDLAQALPYDQLADALVWIFRQHNHQSKFLIEDSVKDAPSTIDNLIKDEEEAIKAYDDALRTAETDEAKDVYAHIKSEEEEHHKELKELKEKLARG